MSKPIHVLIVDDNPSDVMLVRMAMAHEGLEFNAHVIEDGDTAVKHLCPDGVQSSATPPDLIILDLNLPGRDGAEVLRAIRAERCFVKTTVVVLSSSPEYVIEQRMHDAEVQADGYITKPPTLDEFLAIGKTIRECHDSAKSRRM